VHSLHLLAAHNSIRLPLAQPLWAVVVVSVQRRIEEVAHIRHHSACSTQLSQGAGAGAAERGREGAGFDELVVLELSWVEGEGEKKGGKVTLE
jgi:hypothetical protein